MASMLTNGSYTTKSKCRHWSTVVSSSRISLPLTAPFTTSLIASASM
jgi:hypothetical protein